MNTIRDENGKIIGAKALSITWIGQVNMSAVTDEDVAAAEDGQGVSPDFPALPSKSMSPMFRPRGYQSRVI